MDDLDLGATVKGFSPGQKVFRRYTLRKILGRGGMGVVWLGRDEELERDVALKFLPEVVAMDKQSVLELKRETRRSLELTHSHIIRIYDFVQDGQMAAISMEYVPGDTLAALKVDQPAGCYTPGQITKWVKQLCEALEYAHGKAQVVHRDLKPANLMIDARGDLKIADFGIAASVSDSVSRVSAQAGSSGTPVYMSPQQMMGEKPAVTDDIYSLGATLYDLLTGKPPFHSGNIMMQVQNKVPPPLSARRRELGFDDAELKEPFITEAWEQTIASCLAKESAQRPQSAREVAQRLGLAAAATAAPFPVAPPAAKPVPVAKPAPAAAPTAPARSKAPLYAGLAAGVIVLAGLGYYFGAYAPEQRRLAEIRRLEDEGRLAEAARLRNEKEKADLAAKAQTEKEQGEYAVIIAKIDAMLDGAPAAQRDATDKAVKDYLAAAPARFKAEVESRWAKRAAGWDSNRLSQARGGLRVRTVPEGAEVQVGSLTLEKSPVTLRDVRLGKYPVVVHAEGYEEWRGELEVKENEFTDPAPIKLVRSTGTLRIASTPAGLDVAVDGVKMKAPTEMKAVPTGAHEIVFQRAGWPDVRQTVQVLRNEAATAQADLTGGSMEIASTPTGAEIWMNGAKLGATPLLLQDVAPGAAKLELRLPGYSRAQRTVEFVASRREEKWNATLRPGGFLAGRPDFIHGPAEMRVRMTAKTTSPSINTNITRVMDLSMREPGADGVWNQLTEKIVSETSSLGSQYEYTEGTTMVYQRAAGKWTGRLVSGNWRGGAYKAEFDKYLSPFGSPVLAMPGELWPAAETEAGGSWNVAVSGRPSFLGHTENARGTITARLMKITDDFAQIEYAFDLTGTNVLVGDQYRFVGTWQIEVNLAGRHLTRSTLRFKQEGKYPSESTIETEVLSVVPVGSR